MIVMRYLGLILSLVVALSAQAQEKISFDQQVRPILSDKCFFCHGPDKADIKADLQLHTFETATSDRNGDGAAIVPGKPEESLLWHRVTSTDPDEVMPPPKRHMAITKKEAAILRQWIEEGAEYQQLWSFVPLAEKVDVPDTRFSKGRNSVDSFVQAKLAKDRMPSPEAQAEILLRRLYVVTTGLVPTPAEIAAFKADTSGKAYENTIEKLLSSQAFAENLAVDWLDVARYADTYGYQVDRGRETWQWRDWAIRAFRDNMPYDEFIMQQLAGDLMPETDDQKLLATLFNRLHGMKVEGGSIEEEFRTEYVSDRVVTAGTAFLGLTMECTRCHDHKYDPLTAKDFFSMFALFNNIDESGLLAYFNQSVPSPTMMLMSDGEKAELAKRKAAVTAAESAYQAARQSEDAAFAEWRKSWDGTVTPAGLVARWDFDSMEGGKAKNLAPGAKGGVSLGGNTHADQGLKGKAVHFDGDTKMHLGAVGPFSRNETLSISLGINPGMAHKRAVILHRSKAWTDAGSRGYELLIHEGKLDFALIHFAPGNEIRIRTRTDIPVNAWTHITMSYDGSGRAAGIRFFLNGELADTDIIKDNLNKEINTGQKVELAARMRDNGFKNSMIDELAFYNRAITALEAREIYNPANDIGDGTWDLLEPSSATSKAGAILTRQADASWLASGTNAKDDQYTIVAKAPAGATALRLEALTHASFKRNGPGRASNGNIGLSDITITATINGKQQAITLVDAYATHQQNTGNLSVKSAIDGDIARTGWAVDLGGIGKDQAATFLFDKPLEAGAALTIQMTFQLNTQHNIGRFRLAIRKKKNRAPAKPVDESELRNYFLATASKTSQDALSKLAVARKAFVDYENGRKRMMVMREMPDRRPTFVMKRGLYSDPDPKQPVQPGPPEAIFPFGPEYPRNRLGFAQWLLHPQHPLTARVAVNRYWQMIFGTGIVSTTNDLGFQGATPTHPELLDYLSRYFIDSGWDVRALFRHILSSHTFRQDSSGTPELLARDPGNKTLARGPSFHLPAEALRDSAFHASGRLNQTFGGGPQGVQSTRRSVYLKVTRNTPAPEMLTFGTPRRQVCSVKREKTSTPLQPLVLMNSPLYVAGARGVAMAVMDKKDVDDDAKLAELFQRLASRSPQPDEAGVLRQLLADQLAYFRASPEVSKNLNKTGAAIRGKDSPELAAWTVVASAVMNLDSFYMLR
jgi:hypothetical protein